MKIARRFKDEAEERETRVEGDTGREVVTIASRRNDHAKTRDFSRILSMRLLSVAIAFAF